jgi:hypothetical protein
LVEYGSFHVALKASIKVIMVGEYLDIEKTAEATQTEDAAANPDVLRVSKMSTESRYSRRSFSFPYFGVCHNGIAAYCKLLECSGHVDDYSMAFIVFT